MKRVIYCESCDAEFKISHHMDNRLYSIEYCPFCCEDIGEENEDELEEFEEDE